MGYIDNCERGCRCIEIWDRNHPEEGSVIVPYRCGSWRHAGPCCESKGRQDFARVQAAILSRTHWSYVVLTFDQRQFTTKKSQYIIGCRLWSMMRQRITRRFGKFAYIQTWESFKSGGAHVNVSIASESFFHAVVPHQRAKEKAWKRSHPTDDMRRFETSFERDWLSPNAAGAGFGKIVWADRVDCTPQRLAGYLCKMSEELTGATKKDQRPIIAPKGFRRLRASRGLLPKKLPTDWTGAFWYASPEEVSYWRDIPILADDGLLTVATAPRKLESGL